uniref:NAD(P)(+)--arginine ADP-ribosyltransferase n=1 Tax=Erpetoichthys calabaricus TaxID=27687 RepID=A0A8C4RKS4_ERPCA
ICQLSMRSESLYFILQTSLTYEDSYDDDYKGCFQQREMQIKKGYLSCEMKHNWALKHAWDKAWAYWSYQIPPKLDRDTATAVTAYTSNSLFSQLNSAVEGGTHKVTNGYFRSMHLLLTKAIQILRPGNCITTYRGINVFIPLKKGEMFRFGRFASSTTIWHIAQGFGLKMFFIIRTCYGANIAPYSLYKSESEVLIPPYEVFTVTSFQIVHVGVICSHLACDVVYIDVVICMYSPRVSMGFLRALRFTPTVQRHAG